MEMFKCEWCGNKLWKSESAMRKSKRFFCNRACRNQWASMKWVYPKVGHDKSLQRKLKGMAVSKVKGKGLKGSKDEKMELFLRRRE